MANGGILHPLDVNDVVHMPVPIHQIGGHFDFELANRIHFQRPFSPQNRV
jgi:hypothetical protein